MTEMAEVLDGLKRAHERCGFAAAIESRGYDREFFAALWSFYTHAQTEILGEESHIWAIDPYEVDWTRVFTPIEASMWHDIRAAGAVLYPQFPVGQFFADFANPKAMVVVECDGAKFHGTQKDRDRDAWMRAQGWSVYRAPGRLCKTDSTTGEDANGREFVRKGECREFIESICRAHRISGRFL